jgi:hypothetical protein
MKTTSLIVLTMSWAALMPATGSATPSSTASQRSSPEASVSPARGHPGDAGRADVSDDGKHLADRSTSGLHPERHRASTPNHAPSRAGLTSANRPKQLPNNRQRSPRGNATNLEGSGSSRDAGKGGLMPGETARNTLASRTSSAVWTRGPSLNVVQHRGTGPAVLSGSVNADRRNNGAINGTRMNRKP